MARKRNDRVAIRNGQALAASALKNRRVALRTRAAALADLARAPGARKRAATATAPLAMARAPSAGVLVAEGDSWFDYPYADVLQILEDEHGFDLESVAHRGDTVEDMAYGGGQLENFARRIERVLRRGQVPRAILLSGGGNDLAGDAFALLLNHAASGAPGLNDDIVGGVIDQRLRDSYATILSAVTAVCAALLPGQPPVRIVVHGYDYPVADGRGFAGGWGPLPGPWLEPGFRRKGYATLAQRTPLLVALIDRFNRMLRALCSQAAFAHVRHLDLRNTLSRAPATYKQSWANEMHPTRDGFRALALRFKAAI